MITLHFHLQPQYKYELFHIYFTRIFMPVKYVRYHKNFLSKFLSSWSRRQGKPLLLGNILKCLLMILISVIKKKLKGNY